MSNLHNTENLEDRTIKIVIQSTRGKNVFSFPKLTKIADVIDKAVQFFDFQQGDRFELVLATKPGEPLQPQETLASYQIEDDSVPDSHRDRRRGLGAWRSILTSLVSTFAARCLLSTNWPASTAGRCLRTTMV